MTDPQKPVAKTYKREIAALALVVWLASYVWIIAAAEHLEQAKLALLTAFVSASSLPVFTLVASMFGLDSYNKQTRHDKTDSENGS